MEVLSNLNTFAKILTDKGYNGYFHTQGAYPGKIKDSITAYLENCRNGNEGVPKPQMLLTGYLRWAGEDKPRVECCMWVKYLNGKFFLNKMEVSMKDRYGQLMMQSELKNLSIITAPKIAEAIAMVSQPLKQNVSRQGKRFKL